jgi:hypothetical protein
VQLMLKNSSALKGAPPLELDPAFRSLSPARQVSVRSHLAAPTAEAQVLQVQLHALRTSPDYQDGSYLERHALMRGFARVVELDQREQAEQRRLKG